MTEAARWVVPQPARGSRIDRVVADHLGVSRSRAQALVTGGDVTVDGVVVAKSHTVRGGERVTIAARPAAAPRPPPDPVPVRHDDEDLLVVAKPAGLVVHAGAGVRDGTLVDALVAMGVPLAPSEDPARPGIVHRLDRGTSGLLVVAKTARARDGLRALFDAHRVQRRYWALVDGAPSHPRATIDAPIVRHPTDRTRFVTAPDGRPAVSHFSVAQRWQRASRLDVRLETGRTHQVRVHLSALGHPVCGDLAYGASPQLSAALGVRRPALHARHLAFVHPVTGATVSVDEPVPEDLQEAVRRLEAGVV